MNESHRSQKEEGESGMHVPRQGHRTLTLCLTTASHKDT
jgi:hypothetical protein